MNNQALLTTIRGDSGLRCRVNKPDLVARIGVSISEPRSASARKAQTVAGDAWMVVPSHRKMTSVQDAALYQIMRLRTVGSRALD